MTFLYSFVGFMAVFCLYVAPCLPERTDSSSSERSVQRDTPLPDLRKFLQDTTIWAPIVSKFTKCVPTSGSWSGKLMNLIGQDSFDLTLDIENSVVKGSYIFYRPFNKTDSLEPLIYSASGYLRNDSIFFRTDSIYVLSWAKEYKGNFIRRRFSCACIEVARPNTYSLGPQQYLVGQYIDSSFMDYPMFGYFILKNRTSW